MRDSVREYFNGSRQQIWMNEQAFPGEAVNTIGFRLYTPGKSAGEMKQAADRVIHACQIFGVCLKEEKGTWYFIKRDEEPECSRLQKEAALETIHGYCEKAEAKRLADGQLYEAEIWPVTENGSLLSFRFHHILVDGYSMCQIAQRILDALDGKEQAPAPFHWEEEPPKTLEDRKFWEAYLDGIQAEGRILPGKPKGVQRFRLRYELSEQLTEQIEDFAEKEGVSAAAVFSAALSLYLARAGQAPEAVFLMPRLNRDMPQKREHIGCHTQVIPVRVLVDEDGDFGSLCRMAALQAKNGAAHKGLGLGNILRDLTQKGQAADGISQYTLNIYQPRLSASFPFQAKLSMDGAMHNHLTLNLTRLHGTWEICYDCREGIYSEQKAENFHLAFLSILEQGVTSGKPVGSFSILGRKEEQQLLQMEGKTVSINREDTIPSMFERAADQFGERPALYAKKSGQTVCMTYRELDGLSNRVANALLSGNIGNGEPVLFMLNRDYRLLPVLLGILKAGAAFVPVDPKYPSRRVDYIINNSQAPVLISSKEVREAAGRTYLEADELLGWPDDSRPHPFIPQEQLAYCIYTSGTTGNPKGVMLSHRGIVNIVHPDNNPFNRDICRYGKGIVAVGSICFDISLFEIFVPLLNGMFVELAPEEALADPERLADLLMAHGANLLHCTPSRLAAYRKNPRFASALSRVRAVLSAGEVLPGSLVEELKALGVRIYNGYGPTETTIGATVTEAGDAATIGRPIANMGIMILDRKGRLLPEGAAGELCIYGPGVGIGYRGLPEATREKFVTCYGKRVYRTGDLGYFLEDGRIMYRGRGDHQVKLRGLRIELSEIENRMCSFPGIGEACVLVRTLAGSQHLAGFYTVQPGKAVRSKELREYLKEHLTFYMIPDVFKELQQMPQTPGGKTDRKALEQEEISYVRTYREPETILQKKICEAFSSVLGEERIGLEDNFFELGGDSLHIAELVTEIEERIGKVSLEFDEIFQYPTPELLAARLEGTGEADERKKQETNPLQELDYQEIDRFLSSGAGKDGGSGAPGNKAAWGNREVSGAAGISRHSLGHVLLTGATGFLGIHILMELLKRRDSWERISCLVRPTKRLTAEGRLRGVLFYYGEEDWEELLGDRLFAVEGDIGREGIFSGSLPEQVDTIINCAADVSHFAYDDKLEQINTGGVRRLLDFARNQKAAFVQVSTISVGGFHTGDGKPQTLTEQKLYIGQMIENRYILSKYMAEYELLLAAAREKVPVKIMRVGNLQGRLTDGEFQMNGRTNAFIRRLAAYVKFGAVPRSVWSSTVNLSPVDEVARNLTALAALPKEYAVFHVYPPQEVAYERIFHALESAGHPVKVLEDEEFEQLLNQMGQTREGRAAAEGLLLEREKDGLKENPVSAGFTEEVLEAIGEQWNPVDDTYLEKSVQVLDGYGIFE